MNERLERDLSARIAADLGDRFGDFNPDLVTAVGGRAGDETEGRLCPGLFVYWPPPSQVAGGSSPQSNGVDVDDRGLIYLADRIILELRR